MRPLKDFEEFLKEGIVSKRKKDISRAKALVKEAEKRRYFLNKLKRN